MRLAWVVMIVVGAALVVTGTIGIVCFQRDGAWYEASSYRRLPDGRVEYELRLIGPAPREWCSSLVSRLPDAALWIWTRAWRGFQKAHPPRQIFVGKDVGIDAGTDWKRKFVVSSIVVPASQARAR
jgi:hypothetical protein